MSRFRPLAAFRLPPACLAVACLAWVCLAVGGPLAAQEASLVLLDGRTLAVQSLQLRDGKLTGEGLAEPLALDDLRRIATRVKPAPLARPDLAVELVGGGRLLAKQATIGGDQVRLEGAVAEGASFAIDAVRALRFEPLAANEAFEKALATPMGTQDRIFIKVDGAVESVGGLIEKLTDQELSFQFEGQSRTLAHGLLWGIVVAQPAAEAAPPRCTVALRDGSELGGDLVSLAAGKATLRLPGKGEVVFPWDAVTGVIVRSGRVLFLSDLKPAAVEEQAIVTLPRPWRRDQSAAGKPLALGEQTYEKGLGVHALSRLTFAVDGSHDQLAATIGLDPSAGGRGDCQFVVLGDGAELFSRRVRGTDAPFELRVPVKGVKRLTLAVEPGQDLDLADHANWCDVRLIKDPSGMAQP